MAQQFAQDFTSHTSLDMTWFYDAIIMWFSGYATLLRFYDTNGVSDALHTRIVFLEREKMIALTC